MSNQPHKLPLPINKVYGEYSATYKGEKKTVLIQVGVTFEDDDTINGGEYRYVVDCWVQAVEDECVYSDMTQRYHFNSDDFDYMADLVLQYLQTYMADKPERDELWHFDPIAYLEEDTLEQAS